jgi:hypothetical protein
LEVVGWKLVVQARLVRDFQVRAAFQLTTTNQQLEIIMKNLVLFSFLALTFAFISCNEKATSGPSHPEFMLGQTFDLALGKTMQLKGSDFTLNFAEVTEDSRCPEGVNCIRAGEVIFTLNSQSVKKAPKKEAMTMIGEYKITVTAVSPYPKDGVQMDRTSYVLSMVVSK